MNEEIPTDLIQIGDKLLCFVDGECETVDSPSLIEYIVEDEILDVVDIFEYGVHARSYSTEEILKINYEWIKNTKNPYYDNDILTTEFDHPIFLIVE